MIFTILLISVINVYMVITNTVLTSISSYLSLMILLSFIGYIISFIVGMIRVSIQDSSLFLSKMFEHILVDVYVDNISTYIKYNILELLAIIIFISTTMYVMKGAI